MAEPRRPRWEAGDDRGGSAAKPPQLGSSASNVDVEAVLTRLAAQKKEKLDWRHSIVDLMKVFDLVSSLSARKQLAQELHYTGTATIRQP